jgi:hypothetical protein
LSTKNIPIKTQEKLLNVENKVLFQKSFSSFTSFGWKAPEEALEKLQKKL